MDESRDDFLLRCASEMRSDMTGAERKLRRMLPCEWQAQEPLLGRYIADFFHPLYRIVVEADGGYHAPPWQRAKDASRDAAMRGDKITVLRFTNIQIIRQSSWVFHSIDRAVDTARHLMSLPPLIKMQTSVRKLTAEQALKARGKRLNGGKRKYHVITARDPIDLL